MYIVVKKGSVYNGASFLECSTYMDKILSFKDHVRATEKFLKGV